MKTMILIAMCAAMAACAVDEPKSATTATHEQSLICDPCDPGNFQSLVNAMVGAGSGLGSQIAGTTECYHYEGGYDPNDDGTYTYHPAHDECAGTWVDPWGQNYRVSCNSLASVGCGHYACGYDQSQLPCN